MGILFGNETKKCPECGMIIPSEARKCPYCRTEFGEPSLSDDLNRFGCLGYPSVKKRRDQYTCVIVPEYCTGLYQTDEMVRLAPPDDE